MVKRDWTACLEYDNHSKLNHQHNGGGEGEDLYEYTMSVRILSLIMNERITQALKMMRKWVSIWSC